MVGHRIKKMKTIIIASVLGIVAGNISLKGNATLTGGATVDQNAAIFPFLSQTASSTLTTLAGSLVNLLGENIQNVIVNKGQLNINDDNIAVSTSTTYAIDSSTAGSILDVNGASIANLGTGGCMNVNNGATSNPNAITNASCLLGVGTTNAITAGTASTYIQGYIANTVLGARIYATGSNLGALSQTGLNVEGNSLLNIGSGFVGLGTSTPVTNLSVQGNQYTSGTAFFGGAITATSTLTLTPLGTPAGSFLAVNPQGTLIATTTPSGSGAVSSVANSDSTLTISPTTGAVVASLNLANPNTWTGTQTFNNATNALITGAGLVGIGTTTPWGLLSVNANALGRGVPQFVVGSSTGTNFIVANNGNVGIGTTSPLADLSVSSPAQQLGSLPLFAVASSTNATLFNVLGNGKTAVGSTTPNAMFTVDTKANPMSSTTQAFQVISGVPGSATIASFQGSGGSVIIDNSGDITFSSIIQGQSAVLTSSFAAGLPLTLQSSFGGTQTGNLAVIRQNNGPTFDVIGPKGNLGIGTTSPYALVSIVAASTTLPQNDLLVVASTTNGTATTSHFRVNSSGQIYMPNVTTSAGLQTGVVCLSASGEVINDSVACLASAQRYKTNIATTTFSLDGLMKLQPVSFDWKKDFLGGNTSQNLTGTQYSLIADEVQKVFPQLTYVTDATTTFEGQTYPAGTTQGLADTNHWVSAIVSWLQQIEGQIGAIVNAVNYQQSEIATQQKEIDTLTAQVKALQK